MRNQKVRTVNIRNPLDHSSANQRLATRAEPQPFLPAPTRRLDSVTLFRGEHEIGIEHHGALYQLKITRQGKLILNK